MPKTVPQVAPSCKLSLHLKIRTLTLHPHHDPILRILSNG